MAGPAGAGGGSGQKRGRPAAAAANAGNATNAGYTAEPASGATVHPPLPGPNLGPVLQVSPNFAEQHTKRIVMAFQSGLKGELAWAINALTLLIFKEKDDTRKDAMPLAKVPGLLDSLLHVINDWRDIAHERVFANLSRPRLLGADQPYTGFGLEYEIASPDDALLHIRAAGEKNAAAGEDGADAAAEAKEGWCWDEEGLFNLDEIGRHEKQLCAVAVSNVLRNLSFMPENEASIAQHRRCLETLISVLEDHETEDEELVTNSIETLLNLSSFLCFKIFSNNVSGKASNTGSTMSEKRLIDAIMMMLTSPVVPWHCSAAELLGRLVVNPDNEPSLLPFVSQIFPRLVELLSTDASGDALAAAVAALHNFAEIHTDCRLRLANERWAVGRLLRVVGSGRDYPQEICRKAALTLESLASEPQNRAVMLSFESAIAELAVVDQRMSDVFARILWELSSGISSKMGASLVKLQVLRAELQRSMKELERMSIGQKAESSFCLEIVDALAQEWALEVNRALSEFRRNEGALEDVLERKDMEIKKLTEELQLTLWEHEAESSIYLEVAGERACEWRQLIDNLPGDFNRKQIVRRKELQASSSFSGRTQKDNLAFEDASPLVQGDMEGLKSALRKPSPLKGLSTLCDQSVSSPGKATDPIYVVVRRNTQAAVEGFMVDIGESPSKRTNKEVVSSLKLEVLDLRREKEQLIDHHTDELNKLEFELRNECERMKVELEQECQDEIARLQVKLESQHRKEVEQIKNELNQKFQIQIADLQEELETEYWNRTEAMEAELKQRCQHETAELQENLELEYRNLIEKTKVEVVQNHRNVIADLQETLELGHRKEVDRNKVELQEKHEIDLANLQQKLDYEARKKGEWKLIELEGKFQNEIVALEEKLGSVMQKLEQGLQDKRRQQSSAESGGNILPEIPGLRESRESSNISLGTMGRIDDTLTQFELEVVTLVAERDELRDRVSILEIHISELQEKVTKLEGERSWLEERVPGLEKKLATEQSRLEDTVAGHAFERDQLKLIVSSHKNEQTKLENELAERKAERNYLAISIAMLALACRNLKVSNQNERERWRSAYMMALKDMERALSRTQKQVKDERAQKGSAESDAQRMKAEIFTLQQESKDVWRLLERTIAEHISRAVGISQQVEFGLCRKIHQQTLRFEAVQEQVDNLLQALRRSQMSEMDYLHTVENLQRAEQEVDVLGDEVDSLVALLEKVHVVMDQYAPVLLHYPGVGEVAKLVEYELCQRDLLPMSSHNSGLHQGLHVLDHGVG